MGGGEDCEEGRGYLAILNVKKINTKDLLKNVRRMGSSALKVKRLGM